MNGKVWNVDLLLFTNNKVGKFGIFTMNVVFKPTILNRIARNY